MAQWAIRTWPDAKLHIAFEIPFANARYLTLYPPKFRAFGRDIAAAVKEFLEQEAKKECISGVYPHLAMFNDEGISVGTCPAKLLRTLCGTILAAESGYDSGARAGAF